MQPYRLYPDTIFFAHLFFFPCILHKPSTPPEFGASGRKLEEFGPKLFPGFSGDPGLICAGGNPLV